MSCSEVDHQGVVYRLTVSGHQQGECRFCLELVLQANNNVIQNRNNFMIGETSKYISARLELIEVDLPEIGYINIPFKIGMIHYDP